MPSPARVMAPPYHFLSTLSLMPPQQKGQNAGEKEEDEIHDAKRPTRLQHRTVLIDVSAPLPASAVLLAIISKYPEVNVDVSR